MLRFLTAGESHGQTLVVTLDGMPAGLQFDIDALNEQLRRRQGGYGRGRRMAIESDRVEILTGIRHGQTTGAPIALLIRNRDWVNWQQTMYVEPEMPEGASGVQRPEVTRPRPGHADLAGAIKYGHEDIRDVLERASARETAGRVAAGSLACQLLARFGVRIASHVSIIGDVKLRENRTVSFVEAQAIPEDAPLRCADDDVQQRMIAAIDKARDAGDTLGGAFEIIAAGVPPGLGSYVQWDRKLDGRLGQALMCIHAIKAVGIGLGPEAAVRPGSRVHDEILPGADAGMPVRPTNNAGGLEGGVTNGEDVRVVGFMKPISTLLKPLRSVDLATMSAAPAAIERSDVCAVPAAAVVGEAMVAFVLADAFLEKFGGDSIEEITRHYEATAEQVRRRFAARGACMIRPILRYGDQVLHQAAAPITGITPDIEQLIDDMVQAMYAAPGIGLAATQVGVSLRIFVADVSGGHSQGDLITFINPEVVEVDGTQHEDEGCLSVPGFNAAMGRPARAVVKGLARDGREQVVEGTGLLARCLQHEMDHLDGTLFVDRLHGLQKDLIVRKIKKLSRSGQW